MMYEMKNQLEYLENKLNPAALKVKYLKRKKHGMTDEGLTVLHLKHHLIVDYCTNIAFYLHLKAKGVPLRNHAIVQRLLKLKQAFDMFEQHDKELEVVIEHLMAQKVSPEDADTSEEEMDEIPAVGGHDGLAQFFEHKTSKNENAISLQEAREAMEYYNTLAKSKKVLKEAKSQYYTPPSFIPMNDEVPENAKRAASYQIMKNRGLVAHKSKITRNPRVKKRVQYRRALIRRKGQVQNVRAPESNAYGGETTGIKRNISRSRKF